MNQRIRCPHCHRKLKFKISASLRSQAQGEVRKVEEKGAVVCVPVNWKGTVWEYVKYIEELMGRGKSDA